MVVIDLDLVWPEAAHKVFAEEPLESLALNLPPLSLALSSQILQKPACLAAAIADSLRKSFEVSKLVATCDIKGRRLVLVTNPTTRSLLYLVCICMKPWDKGDICAPPYFVPMILSLLRLTTRTPDQ